MRHALPQFLQLSSVSTATSKTLARGFCCADTRVSIRIGSSSYSHVLPDLNGESRAWRTGNIVLELL